MTAPKAEVVRGRLALGHGMWCWGCARRFVRKDEPRPHRPDIKWAEGLCGSSDCPAERIAGNKR